MSARPVVMMAVALFTPLLANAGEFDSVVKAQLDTLGLKYTIDDDGDFKLVFDVGEGRTQIGWVRSSTSSYGSLKVREIWSPGYLSTDKSNAFPAPIANRLLESSNEVKLGAWVKQGKAAVFVVKISASAPQDVLRDAIEAAFNTADKIELEITKKDDL